MREHDCDERRSQAPPLVTKVGRRTLGLDVEVREIYFDMAFRGASGWKIFRFRVLCTQEAFLIQQSGAIVHPLVGCTYRGRIYGTAGYHARLASQAAVKTGLYCDKVAGKRQGRFVKRNFANCMRMWNALLSFWDALLSGHSDG